ncbi:hypothetical protein [Streptomyces sp. MST-110588]|uniref:hypothetical protein n=1 Tax=Streptomyces sp. MST-110588 TaxID=2833628 RepID=UPI001F5CD207|nr:hypothetical protein [Streptomyces sp. MST-110588]UNO40350.1 hypothetical protein KGS77_13125 [Streptomyces sp. MST-110588]
MPIPDALDDRALAAAVRPHTGRARTALLAGLTVIVLAGAGAGVAALVMSGDGTDGKRDTATQTQTQQTQQATGPHGNGTPSAGPPAPTRTGTPPSPGTGSPGTGTSAPPTATVTPTPSPGANGKAPDGYRMTQDPLGFALAVPDGFSRSYEKPRVFYYSAGKRFRLGVYVKEQMPGGPLAMMRASDTKGPQHYPGYRDAQVTDTTHNGFPAALWEFTWDGGGDGGGARHTYDLGWEEAGKMYDVWVSAPVGDQARAKRHFDAALDTFRVTGER